MKKTKTIYWIATGIFSLMMLFSATMYFIAPEMKATFNHLGFPDYFRIQLGIAKLLGALTLLLPFIPKGFKQFAYAGFTVNLVSATVAHIAKGDPAPAVIGPLVLLALLAVSYIYYNKLQQSRQLAAI